MKYDVKCNKKYYLFKKSVRAIPDGIKNMKHDLTVVSNHNKIVIVYVMDHILSHVYKNK